VEDICTQTGSKKIMLVTHSMGGLVARAYLHKLDGAERVSGLITLGAPHHGSALAAFPIGENIKQIQLNDPWLAALNTSESHTAPVPITSVYTAHDNLISPQASSRLVYAENIRLTGIGHTQLLFSEKVAKLVSEFITRYS
jgi:triacylglycerol esterase/lipase EstA (alpha/beta hydrolase family)